MRRSSRLWLGVLIVALAAGLATAQTFTESTQVVVVEVPVQVVRDGEPVKGLTAADFEVFDGRKKVPITGFEVLDLTTATTGEAQAGQEPPPVTARRHFLVLFDLSFSDPKAIIQARKAAQEMVGSLHPTDLVAVATYSNKGPQIALGFTADRRQITAAIETLGLPEMVDRNPDPLRLLVADAASALTQPSGGAGGLSDARQAALEAALENMETLERESARVDASAQKAKISAFTQSTAALARMMDAVDGRKYVIFLSEGFDTSLVQGSQDVETQNEQSEAAARGEIWNVSSETRFGDTKSLNEIEKMLEEFRRADCIVQAVDIGGLRAAGAVEGNSRGRGGKDSLLQIARGTGGELFENTNNLAGAMQEVLKRTSVTYVLAFQPDALKWDGNYRRIKVEVKGQPRGTRLVHRPGYYAPKPYTAQNPMEKMMDAASALVSGEESGNVKMAVLAAPFRVTGGDKAYVPVVLEVDGPSLLANTTGTALPAEIYIYAMDSGGAVHDFVAQTLGLDVSKAGAQLRQSGLKFFGHVDLYPGDYTIRVMVRNGATGALSVRVVPVRVPAFAEAGPFLLPPFFPESPGKWLMAREAPREGQAANVEYPFMQDQQPYIPASKPVLTPGQDAPLSLVAYNLGAGDIKAQARVLSADGKEMGAGDLKLLGTEGGSPSRLKASFRPPALQPGDYRLKVTLQDPSGATHSSSTEFSVGGGGKATR